MSSSDHNAVIKRKIRNHTHIILCIVSLLAQTTTPWPFRWSNRAPTIVWEEEGDDDTQVVSMHKVNRKREKQRDLVWLFGPPRKKDKKADPNSSATSSNLDIHHLPHPLRTDQWELQVNWRNVTSDMEVSMEGNDLLFVDFAENGYLRATFDKTSKHFTIGHWELTPAGFKCKLNDTLLLHADLHLNPFGKQPRLTRGVIVDTARTGWKDRRLVVGSFTGRGIGRDTADLAYRRRK